jgi:hypothetical protein
MAHYQRSRRGRGHLHANWGGRFHYLSEDYTFPSIPNLDCPIYNSNITSKEKEKFSKPIYAVEALLKRVHLSMYDIPCIVKLSAEINGLFLDTSKPYMIDTSVIFYDV